MSTPASSQLSLFDLTLPERLPAAELELKAPPRDVPSQLEVLEKAERLARLLSVELGLPVRLAVTDNRSTMISFRRAQSALRLRLHHMFLDAPEPVVVALADYAGRGRHKAGTLLDDFIRGQQPRIRKERGKNAQLVSRGRCFDLDEMYQRVNREHFQEGVTARIGWGRHRKRRGKRSIRLGVYDHQTKEIRIHPALDRPDVPAFFVEFIVFHEMLHQLFPSTDGSGRRVHHPRAFRDREKKYPLYLAALRWEKQNIRLLLKG